MEFQTPVLCIIKNNLRKLQGFILRGDWDINGLYHSVDWTDDITPLIAAVLCRNEEICSYLLRKSADPNIHSTDGWTPLHYAALTPGVPLSIVKRLLAAKADPDGHEEQIVTPLQCAVDRNREDIVKALIEAGASPVMNYGRNSKLDKKVERMIHQLSSQGEVFEKVHLFFSFYCAAQTKHQTEVYSVYKEHFFQEDPFIHTVLLELYYGVTSQGAERYRQSAIKWLKDTKSADRYIEGVIKRFPRIPQEYLTVALNCLYVALCVSESVSPEVFRRLETVLANILQHFGNTQGKKIHLILKILNVMMQKTSEQKIRMQKLCMHLSYYDLGTNLLPLTHPNYSSLIGMMTYGLFANINDFAPELVRRFKLSPVPETILIKAETEMDEVMKKKLQKLDKSLRHSCKRVQPFTQPPENSNISRRWHQTSRRWSSELKKLANIDDSKTYRLPGLTLVIDSEFLIANGSAGTEVFLGLRDDGTEVAVKRMTKINYHFLKNEEKFLRLPELDSPSIVRYVDFAEDDNFGYLVLQLCEYTLEEYIQNQLPDDSAERTSVLKKLVKEVLCSLQVLHNQQTKVLHRDIKPQNVLIDINGKARLADFGISRQMDLSQTTLRTRAAGTRCWKAKETIDEESNTRYKRSSDIQVAGMLVYYILSGGHHPFGKGADCEYNISRGRYSLEHLDDDVAKDLIAWMINKQSKERPTAEQTLAHPFFWTDDRRVEYLKKLGNQKEVENCRKADEELLHAVKKYTEGKSFSEWKTKLPSELVQKLDGKKKAYPENTLGLLRFIRNLHEHYPEDAESINLMASFPDLFGSVFRFAKETGWNSRENLKKFFSSTPQM